MDLERLAEKLHDGGWTENEIRCGLLAAEVVIGEYSDMLLAKWTQIELQRIARQVAARRR